jgi:hypothetical protein
MGEGSRRWPVEEFNVDDCDVWLLPWAAASGRRWVPAVVALLLLPLGSTIGLLVILVGRCEGLPRRTSGSLEQNTKHQPGCRA